MLRAYLLLVALILSTASAHIYFSPDSSTEYSRLNACDDAGCSEGSPCRPSSPFILQLDSGSACIINFRGGNYGGARFTVELGTNIPLSFMTENGGFASDLAFNITVPTFEVGLEIATSVNIQAYFNHTAFNIHHIPRINIQASTLRDFIASIPHFAAIDITSVSFDYSVNAITSSAPITSHFGGYQGLTHHGMLPFVIGRVNELDVESWNGQLPRIQILASSASCKVDLPDFDSANASICESFFYDTTPLTSEYNIQGTFQEFPSIIGGSISSPTSEVTLAIIATRSFLNFGHSVISDTRSVESTSTSIPSSILSDSTVTVQSSLNTLVKPTSRGISKRLSTALPIDPQYYYSLPLIPLATKGRVALEGSRIAAASQRNLWTIASNFTGALLRIDGSALQNAYISMTDTSESGLEFQDASFWDSQVLLAGGKFGVFIESSRFLRSSANYPSLIFQKWLPDSSSLHNQRRFNISAGWHPNVLNPPTFSEASMPHLLLEDSIIYSSSVNSELSVARLGLIGSSILVGSLEVSERIDAYAWNSESPPALVLGNSSAKIVGGANRNIDVNSVAVPALKIDAILVPQMSFVTLHSVTINGAQIYSKLPVLYKYDGKGKPISLTGYGPRLWNASFSINNTPEPSNITPSSSYVQLEAQSASPLPRFNVQWSSSSIPYSAGELHPMLKFVAEIPGRDRFQALPEVENLPFTSDNSRFYNFKFDSSPNTSISFYSGTLCPVPKPSPAGYFNCSNGNWIFTPGGNGATPSAPSAPSNAPSGSTTVIVISSPITIISDFDPSGYSIVFQGLSTPITVQGCSDLPTNTTIILTPEETETLFQRKGGKYEVILIHTDCNSSLPSGSTNVKIDAKLKSCQTIKARLEARTSGIVALFDISDSKCNLWWIILVSVIGGVLLIALILVLVFTLIPSARRCIRPYSARNDMVQSLPK